MRTRRGMLKQMAQLGLLLMMVASMSAQAGLFGFGGTSWKEEVLLHDGSKIIVKRSQSYGGRHEIGQSSPVKEHTITFSLPNSGKAISWTSEYGEDLGRTNFNLLALHILNGSPYLVVEPNLCLSYNKWGRPNPPYVFFKHDGKKWQRLPLSEFPAEFKIINLIVNNGREEDIASLVSKSGFVPADGVRQINSSLRQPEYKTILREALPQAQINQMCMEEVTNGKGTWLSIDWFSSKRNREACLEVCFREEFDAEHCPCNSIFKGK